MFGIKTAISQTLFRQDGVDHINLSIHARTKIGRLAAINWRHNFFVPQVGSFASPNNFVAWLITGDEKFRHTPNPSRRLTHQKDASSIALIKNGLLFGKFHQLTALRGLIVKQPNIEKLLDIPWLEYKLHSTGIREFYKDTGRASIIKQMVAHLIEKGNKAPFDSSEFKYSEVKELIMERVGVIARYCGSSQLQEDESQSQEDKSEEA